MRTGLRLLVASLAVAAMPSLPVTFAGSPGNVGGARQCPLTLSSSTAEGQWQIGCAEGFQSTGSVVFDSSQLTVVRVSSSTTDVKLTPENSKKPTEITVPAAFSKVSKLTSSSLTSFSLEGTAGAAGATGAATSTVEIDTMAFTKMTALRKVSVSSVNVAINGPLELSSSLNEVTFSRAGLVDFKVKIVKGQVLNITKLDLSFNSLRRLPLALFASKTLVSCNLENNALAALRLSRRKLARFMRLVASKRILVSEIGDFTDACTDGETKKVQIGAKTVTVCQVPTEEDDDVVVENDDGVEEISADGTNTDKSSSSSWSSSSNSSSSQVKQTNTTTTTTTTTTTINGTVVNRTETTTVDNGANSSSVTGTNGSPLRFSYATVVTALVGVIAMLVL